MELNGAFLDHVTAGGDSSLAELRRLRSRLVSAGALQPNREKWVPLLAAPLVLDESDHALLRDVSEVLCALLADLPTIVFGGLDQTVRALHTPDPLVPFVREDAPFTVTVSRCDFLRGPNGFQITEINTGAAVGELLVDDYNTCVREQPFFTEFLRRHHLHAPAPMQALAAAAFRRAKDLPLADGPRVAVVDWQGYEAEYVFEHRRIADSYRAEGFDAVVCHQRELRYDGRRLWAGRQPVDVVHRSFLLEDLPQDPASAVPVLRAAADGAVVLVSSFRDEWLANKAAFAMMHEAVVRNLLPGGTADLVTRMVPPTWLVTDDPVGWSSFALRHGDARRYDAGDLVLKPVIGSLSAGVILGTEVPADSFWEAVDSTASGGPAHVVQRFVEPAPIPFVWLDSDGLTTSAAQPHPGVFVVEGGYAGASTRMLRGTRPERCSTHYGASAGGVFAPVGGSGRDEAMVTG